MVIAKKFTRTTAGLPPRKGTAGSHNSSLGPTDPNRGLRLGMRLRRAGGMLLRTSKPWRDRAVEQSRFHQWHGSPLTRSPTLAEPAADSTLLQDELLRVDGNVDKHPVGVDHRAEQLADPAWSSPALRPTYRGETRSPRPFPSSAPPCGTSLSPG